MGRKFNNSRARKLGSSDLLDSIDGYYTDEKNIKTRTSAALANLQDENYTDVKNRNACFECASQIYDAYSEGNYLAGLEYDYNNPSSRWISKSSYYLPNYAVPVVSEIKGLDNTVYDKYVQDLSGIWDMFRTWKNDRPPTLKEWQGVYDDDYIRCRYVKKEEITYASIVEDVELTKSWTGSIKGMNKWKKKVVSDIKDKSYDSNPEPTIPNATMFNSLVYQGSKSANALTYFSSALLIPTVKPQDKDWYEYCKLEATNETYVTKYFTIKDEECTESFCDTVMKELPNTLFFIGSDNKTFIYGEVVKKEKYIIESVDVKQVYEENYGQAGDEIKSFIYDNYKEIYYRNKYGVKVTFNIIDSYKETDGEVVLTNSSTASPLFKSLVIKGLEKIYMAKYSFSSAYEDRRCETGDPNTFYPLLIKRLEEANYDTITGCDMVKAYLKEAVTWIETRKVDLLAQTKDDINNKELIALLEKRLNKSTGSVMLWWQDVNSIDQEYKDLNRSKGILGLLTKRMLVTRAVNCEDQTTFKFQQRPNFIDVEIPDSNFYPKGISTGDTIYITDDIHPEITAKVTNSYIIKISSTSYDKVNLESYTGGTLPGSVTQKRNVIRIVLDKRLSDWYSNGNDVSNLRVIKLL